MGAKIFKEEYGGSGACNRTWTIDTSHDGRQVLWGYEMKYNKSWDWLMPVVEKIESLDPNENVTHTYTVEITGNGTTISPSVWSGNRWMIRVNSRDNRLSNTYKAVVEFIKWYNSHQQKP